MISYLLTATIALLAGASELVSRYRDKPHKAVLTGPGFFYLFINVTGALLAYYLIHDVFALDFGLTDQQGVKLEVYRILLAGLGSLAFFRSSLFTVRVGESDVAVGPAGILQIFLNAADRAVDRARAEDRAVYVSQTMRNIDFSKAMMSLPPFCFQLMQNVTAEEQAQIGSSIRELAQTTVDDKVKALILGLSLLNVVGESVLTAAVDTLKDDISI